MKNRRKKIRKKKESTTASSVVCSLNDCHAHQWGCSLIVDNDYLANTEEAEKETKTKRIESNRIEMKLRQKPSSLEANAISIFNDR